MKQFEYLIRKRDRAFSFFTKIKHELLKVEKELFDKIQYAEDCRVMLEQEIVTRDAEAKFLQEELQKTAQYRTKIEDLFPSGE